MEERLRTSPVEYRREVHVSADHGYALPDLNIFDARAAARDWEIFFAMLRRRLSG